jgi:hypothetical protein
MAWISVKEQGHLARSESSATERKATRVFVAVSDAPTTTVDAETASDGTTTIPPYDDPHPDDPGRKVKSVSARPDENANRTVFAVEVEYGSKTDATTAQDENPLARPARVAWDFEDKTEKYFTDRGDPPATVTTSAGERFEELLERDTGSLTATVTKNIGPGDYDPAAALLFKDVVNEDAFTLDGRTIEVGVCKMKSYTAGEVQTENGYDFRVARFILQFRASWDDVIEDRGFHESDGAGKLKEISKGTPPTKVDKPWPLDGSGAAKPNATDEPFALTFFPYYTGTFATFQSMFT